jgi:glycosyltransferase involved in cell wall biosynthesis
VYKVVIVQRRLTHYRLPLFDQLRENLRQRGVSLHVLAGKATEVENRKSDAGVLPWVQPLTTRYFASDKLCWQPIGEHLRGADLVVVTQENKLLYNHWLLNRPRSFKLAFWGHGANLQSDNPNGIKERYKRWTTKQVDWWFAYTQMSADLVNAVGFPEARITVLNNAVDTAELLEQRQMVTQDEISALRVSLGFGCGPVGIYVGSLYPDKRLDFLFEAAKAIRVRVPDFNLLIIGDGTERDMVQSWCAEHDWARWVGAQFGRDKAAHMAVAQILMNPGLVGLGILDGFVCGVPMLTTDCGIHSPEISYLNNGVNGLMTANVLDDYVDACLSLLRDQGLLDRLKAGCAASAKEYTVENMAQRFAVGITRCLEAPRYIGLSCE